MDRRTLLAGSCALLATPLAAEAQQAGKMYRIGLLGITPPTSPPLQRASEAFLKGLRDHGFVEGQRQRFTDFVSEFVRLQVDVIVVTGTPAARAAKQATATIPIVMVYVGDSVGSGLAAGLARPGGNVTGLSPQAEYAGKQLQLLHEIAPSASRVAVMWDTSNPAHARSFKDAEASGQALRIEVRSYPVRTLDELEIALVAIERERATAFLPFDSQVTFVNRRRLVEFAAREPPSCRLWAARLCQRRGFDVVWAEPS